MTEKTKENRAFINIRLEPSLRDAIRQRASDMRLGISEYLGTLIVEDLRGSAGKPKLSSSWTTPESRTVNLNLAFPKNLVPKTKKQASEWNLGLSDYLRSLAIQNLAKPFLKPGTPVKMSALSLYIGKDIIKLLEKAMKMEDLSMAAYQKKLVYRDLEQKFGDQFRKALRSEPKEQWTVIPTGFEFAIEGERPATTSKR